MYYINYSSISCKLDPGEACVDFALSKTSVDLDARRLGQGKAQGGDISKKRQERQRWRKGDLQYPVVIECNPIVNIQ